MPYVAHNMTAMIQLQPEHARAAMVEAFKDARCNRTAAAAAFGCSVGTFINWTNKLGLRGQFSAIEDQAKREGWHHGRNRLSPGNPAWRKTKKRRGVKAA